MNNESTTLQMIQFLFNIRKDINNQDYHKYNFSLFKNILQYKNSKKILPWLYEQSKFSELEIYLALNLNLRKNEYNHFMVIHNINNLNFNFGKISEYILYNFPYDFKNINSGEIDVYYEFVSLLLDKGISWKDNLEYLNKENVRFKYITVFKNLCENHKGRVKILPEIIPFFKIKEEKGKFIPCIEMDYTNPVKINKPSEDLISDSTVKTQTKDDWSFRDTDIIELVGKEED